MKKILTIILAAVLTLTIFAGCASKKEEPAPAPDTQAEPAQEETNEPEEKPEDNKDNEYTTTLDDIKAKGNFIMGLDDTFAPMGFRNDKGELVGFDIDLANAVAEELDINVEFQPVDWDSKEMELATGKIDCIWNGLSLTPERAEKLSMSKPYLENKIIVMTNEGVTIASKEELANYNIGIQAGSAALEAVRNDEVYESVSDKITEYPTYDEVILDMQTGRLDCMIIDQVFGEYKNTQLGNIYGTAEFDFGEDLYAIGLRKTDTALTEDINNAINALIEKGATKEISEKWFGVDIVIK